MRRAPGLLWVCGLLLAVAGCAESQPTTPLVSQFAWIDEQAHGQGVASVRPGCLEQMESALKLAEAIGKPASLQDALRVASHAGQALGTAQEWITAECRAVHAAGKPPADFEGEAWKPLVRMLERIVQLNQRAAEAIATYEAELLKQPESERIPDRQLPQVTILAEGMRMHADDALFWMGRLAVLAKRDDLLDALFVKFGPLRTWTYTPTAWIPTVTNTPAEFGAAKHDWDRLLRR